MSDDDIYEKFQCSDSFWRDSHVRLIFADSGSILLGVSRLLAFFVIFGLNYYNRKLLRTRAQDNMNVIPGIVLPYYFMYIYLYIGISLIAGIIDISIEGIGKHNSATANNWIVPIEQGIFHWLYEGLAFFLLRYGAGIKAFQRALFYSGIWGCLSFITFFMLYSLYRDSYGIHEKTDHTVFGIYIAYYSVLLAFYLVFLVVPHKYLYRRSALDFYAMYNVVFCTFSIIIAGLLYNNVNDAVCGASVILFLLVAIVQPLVLFRALQIDSQYWQGLKPDKGNPLAEVWDHVDLATAQSMAESVEDFNRFSRAALPILHFGLLDFDQNEQFVAGGFSRVYFGKLRQENVAFKILFAMELTPEDVRDFYQEANLLYSLRHQNIVQCKGICVMPPALTMVLEHCKFGSLYDFLYKPVKESYLHDNVNKFEPSGSSEEVTSPLAKMERIELVVNPSQRSSLTGPPQQPATGATIANNANDPLPAVVADIEQPSSNSGLHNSKKEITPLDISKAKIPSTGAANNNNSHNNTNSGNNFILRSSMMENDLGRTSDGRSSGGPSFSAKRSTLSDRDSDRRSSRSSFNPRMSRVFKTYENIANIVTSSLSRIDPRAVSQALSSASGGTSSHPLTIAHTIPFEIRLRMMKDAISGIAFLHSKGFMHCDIKSLNFLVDENFRVKLADMGEVRAINHQEYYPLPPIPARNWAPPEVLMPGAKADAYTVKSEVYGLSLVLVELITLELPFGDLPEQVTGKQWIEKLVTENLRPTLPYDLHPKLKDVITRGLKTEPSLRPNVNELLDVLEICTSQSIGHISI